MKIVIQRHQSDLQVFRALAVAQAVRKAKPDAEVYLECFDKYKGLLDLCPGIKWKNPHHPFEVSFREGSVAPDGTKQQDRKGGKLYDEVISLEPDSPLELELIKSGMLWWDFIKAKVTQQSDLGASLTIADFPDITIPMTAAVDCGNRVLICPLSHFSHPMQVNANGLEQMAKDKFPGAAIWWISPENVFLGGNRPLLRYSNFAQLAWIVKNSVAVIAVNGLVSAIAKSTFAGQPIGKPTIHIAGKYDKGFERDQFLAYAKLMEVA